MNKKKLRIKKLKKLRLKLKRLSVTRLIIFRTSRHIYAQIVEPQQAKILAYASTLEKKISAQVAYTGNKNAAKIVGKIVAKRALKNKIKNVVLDRSGYIYHGRIKALSDSARSYGLNF